METWLDPGNSIAGVEYVCTGFAAVIYIHISSGGENHTHPRSTPATSIM